MEENLVFTQHTVVVIGSMNPAIHNPAWYRHSQLITDVEEHEAYENENESMILVREVSQFSTSAFSIVCHNGRWEIKTTNEDNFDRIEECAGEVFDSLLPHTPVSAFGTNYQFRYKLAGKDVCKRVAELVLKTGIPFSSESPHSGLIKFSDKRSGYTLNTEVAPFAKFEDVIKLGFNADFVVTTDEPQFSLGKILNHSRQALRDECGATANRIIKQIAE